MPAVTANVSPFGTCFAQVSCQDDYQITRIVALISAKTRKPVRKNPLSRFNILRKPWLESIAVDEFFQIPFQVGRLDQN